MRRLILEIIVPRTKSRNMLGGCGNPNYQNYICLTFKELFSILNIMKELNPKELIKLADKIARKGYGRDPGGIESRQVKAALEAICEYINSKNKKKCKKRDS
jgi:hypothetical protein